MSIQDASAAPVITDVETSPLSTVLPSKEVVSTHVLVPEEQVDRLRELSRRTRIAQSEYLREAVDDLLGKYKKGASEEE